jgi:hypothetical protein
MSVVDLTERRSLRDLKGIEAVGIVAKLYRVAPGTDERGKRLWVATRLGMQLRDVNRVLWQLHGIRWDPVPSPKRTRHKAAEPTTLDDLSFAFHNLIDPSPQTHICGFVQEYPS